MSKFLHKLTHHGDKTATSSSTAATTADPALNSYVAHERAALASDRAALGSTSVMSAAPVGESISALANPAFKEQAFLQQQQQAAYTAPAAATTLASTAERIAVPLVEEQLEIRKGVRESGAGALRVAKEVQEQQVSVNVPVSREFVTVERVPASNITDIPANAFQAAEFLIPQREEVVEVAKRPVVREEIQIRKDIVQENRVVTDTLRREDITGVETINANLGQGFQQTSAASGAAGTYNSGLASGSSFDSTRGTGF